MAQPDIHLRFAWHARHKLTSTVVLRGRRGTHGTGWHAWTGLVARDARDAAALCVAGVAQPHIHLRFAWQACHNRTSTIVSRGRRGTHGTGWRAWTGLVARDARDAAALCVAGVAQPHIHRRFAWQAWHNLTATVVLRGRRSTHGTGWHAWTGLVARDARDVTATVVLRGRRGTHGTGWRAWTGLVARDARDAAAFCVAGVAQPDIHLRFAWQARHNLTSTVVLRGRRGTHGTGWRAWTGLVARDARDAAALCVAGVAQTHIHRRFAWQAWHNLTATVVLRGRRGTHGTGWRAWTGLVARDARDAAALCVAGVAQPHIHRRFAWQAWHNLTATVVLRGRRGTHGTGWRPWTGLVARDARDAAALCVAGVAQPHIHLRFAWQACHNRTSTIVSRGSMALMALGGVLGLAWSPVTPVTPRHFAWQAWHNLTSTFVLRGRRGTNSHPPSFCVAGVVLMALGGALGLAWSPVTPVTPRHFAWQAWHKLTSTVVLSGRRGKTHVHRRFAWQAWQNSHPPSFCVAGVALMALGGALGLAWSPVTPVTPRHFAWQAWHNLTSTFVLRGRRGTNSHPPSLCVAGVALMALGGALGLAWSPTSTVVLRGRRGTHGTGWRAWTGLVARDARDAAALCVAGVAQPHIHRRFAWQAWHNRKSTIVLRGRRGTHGIGWRAWTGLDARDAREARDAAALWHNLTSTFVLRGRRGANSHPPSFCVAGVALMALGGALGLAWLPVTPVTPRHFAWQAWHNLTSTFVLRGRRGTISHPPSFRVAGVNFVTHHLSHTTFTHNFVNQHLSYTFFHTQLSHITCHTPSFPPFLSHTLLSHTIFNTPSVTSLMLSDHVGPSTN